MKNPKRYYVGVVISRRFDLEGRPIVLKNSKVGIVGMMPLFTDKRKAQRYVGKKGQVVTLGVVE